MATHYSVLGVSSTASHEEIKSAFHRLARTAHPDKQQQQRQQVSSTDTGNNDKESSSSSFFLSIQKAWETLRDHDLRAAYDDELQHSKFKEKAKRQGAIVLDRCDLEEAVDDETGETIHVYDCRCGEEVILVEGEDDDDMVECPGCCFAYKINK